MHPWGSQFLWMRHRGMWDLKCRTYRDRRIAACGFIFPHQYSNACRRLPEDTIDACLFVAKACLQADDYTPLLVTPSGEDCIPTARWLGGHQIMTPHNWTFGIESHRPKSSVSFESAKLVIELDPLGIVTSICHNACLDFLERADKFFMSVATTVAKRLGTSPGDFNTAIQQLCGISAGITIIRQAFHVRTDIIKLLYLTKAHNTDSDVFTRLVRAKT
jgi:hypothetical protein